jgi:LPS-assembly lipoprotein
MLRLVLVLLSLNLGSCGFHLRGSINLPTELLPMEFVDIRERSYIKPELVRTFIGTEISTENAVANSYLVLENEQFSKAILSISTEGASKSYNINYEIRFHLRDRSGKVTPSQTIVFSRPLEFEQNAVLSSASEEKIIRQEMLTEAAQQILRRLRYVRLADFAVPVEKQVAEKKSSHE